jgi:hypothetical protein
LRIRAGSSTSLIGVASGSSGVGANIIWSLIPVQVPESTAPPSAGGRLRRVPCRATCTASNPA